MRDLMSKVERVRAALRGGAIDRVPVSAFWHDHRREWSTTGLADATLDAYSKYNWDYVKVTPRTSYYAEDWGSTYRRFDEHEPVLERPAVRSLRDLRSLVSLDISASAYLQQLDVLRLIRDRLGSEALFIQTMISPLAVMSRLTGSTAFVQRLIAEAPDDLEVALDTVSRTLREYAAACIDCGASGIFYGAAEWGLSNNISWEDYERFGRVYDLRVLEAIRAASFNTLHVCRPPNHLLNCLDYPVAAFSWHMSDELSPAVANVLSLTNGAVIGGVDASTMAGGDDADVEAEAQASLAQTNGVRHLLSADCSIDPATPNANLLALARAPNSVRKFYAC